MLEGTSGAERVDAADEAAELLQVLGVVELGGTPAAAGIEREAITLVPEQTVAVGVEDGRHHGYLVRGQLLREAVLLGDGRVAPAIRSIELRHQRRLVLHADTVDAILVAVQGEKVPVAANPRRLDGIENVVGGEGGEVRGRRRARVGAHPRGRRRGRRSAVVLMSLPSMARGGRLR